MTGEAEPRPTQVRTHPAESFGPKGIGFSSGRSNLPDVNPDLNDGGVAVHVALNRRTRPPCSSCALPPGVHPPSRPLRRRVSPMLGRPWMPISLADHLPVRLYWPWDGALDLQSLAVVGSMILPTGATTMAGKPLRSACTEPARAAARQAVSGRTPYLPAPQHSRTARHRHI